MRYALRHVGSNFSEALQQRFATSNTQATRISNLMSACFNPSAAAVFRQQRLCFSFSI
jgi:hypothetical protein